MPHAKHILLTPPSPPTMPFEIYTFNHPHTVILIALSLLSCHAYCIPMYEVKSIMTTLVVSADKTITQSWIQWILIHTNNHTLI